MQLLKNKEKINMPSSDHDGSSLNGSGTDSKSDTPLTQPRSGFDLDLTLENTRRDLIAKRTAAGANTPIGHRCSNLIEQLEHYRAATGNQRANLAKSIRRSLTDFDAFQ